jgi:hypothetical protein
MRACYLLLALLGFHIQPCTAQRAIAIGQWRDHYPYLNARLVIEGGGAVYCASRNAVFRYDAASGELERLNKVNALSDVDITALGWNAAYGTLVIGYNNGNVDIIRGENAYNLSDIKRSSVIGDKRVYSVSAS